MKRIILCADDYGQNNAISQAIIDLATQKRLSAISCLTTAKNWQEHSKKLIPLKNHIDIGLHFNLTEGVSLSNGTGFFSLKKLIILAYTNLLKMNEIEKELNYQIDKFEAAMGNLPDFIDGHQHIQQLPLIRRAVLNVYQRRLSNKPCYIRNVGIPILKAEFFNPVLLKKMVLLSLGANRFRKELIKANIPTNASFSGIYNFNPKKDYASLFASFLRETKHNGIIMCHPGLMAHDQRDSIKLARVNEYEFLRSDQFTEMCDYYQIRVGRFE